MAMSPSAQVGLTAALRFKPGAYVLVGVARDIALGWKITATMGYSRGQGFRHEATS